MAGDIIQDCNNGWFYRDNDDGTADSLSDNGGERPATAARVDIATLTQPVVIVRNGQPTGDGDRLAARAAVVMARRYVTA